MTKGTLQIIGGHFLQLFCGYFVIIILARELGPDEYGVYGVIMSVLLWVEVSSRLGIPQTMAKLIPEDDQNAPVLERTALSLSLGVSLSAFSLMVVFAPAIANVFNMPDKVNLFRLAALDIPFYALYWVCLQILNGRRLFGAESLRIIIYAAAKAAGILVLLGVGLSVASALIVNAIASIVGLMFMFTVISFRNIFPAFAFVAPILKLAFPMGLYTIGWIGILNLDIWCLKIFGKDVEATSMGLYIGAANLAKVPSIAAFAMTAVLIPSIARSLFLNDLSLTKNYVQSSMRFLALTLLPICTLVAMTAEDVMALVYSDIYSAGALYLILLIFGHGFMLTFLATFCAILTAKGEAYLAAFTVWALVPCGFLLNILFVPELGAIGAGRAKLVTGILGACFAGLLIYSRFGTLINIASIGKILLANAVVVLGALKVGGEGFWLLPKYFLILGSYIAVLILLKEIKKVDLRLLVSKPHIPQ